MAAADLEPTTPTLSTVSAPARVVTRTFLALVVFPLLVALGAALRVDTPFGVPVTLQTLFVLASGAVLGEAFGPLSMAAYLAYGMLGLPLFARGSGHGFDYLFGATGGYLLALPLASWLAARLCARPAVASRATLRFAALFACGALIVACGGVFRIVIHHAAPSSELPIAFFFLAVEATKSAALTPVLPALRRLF